MDSGKKVLGFLTIIAIMAGCLEINEDKDSDENKTENSEAVTDSTTTTFIDSLDKQADPVDTLVVTNLDENAPLKSYIDYVHERMKNVPNPVRAIYEGTEFGDYFHLSFRIPEDFYLDFADGDNNFSDYELFDSESFESNKQYVGKTFEIHWEYKKSTFLCCDGEMETVVAEMPSIIQLKLIDE